MTLMPAWETVAGGALIGAAALLLYAALGRIAGVSGIAFGAVWGLPAERWWRIVFLAGLVGGGALALLVPGASAEPASSAPAGLMLASGFLVGFGTLLGNGCTSGHGICGLSRRSPRSLVSVAVFMGIGMLSATLLRPWLP